MGKAELETSGGPLLLLLTVPCVRSCIARYLVSGHAWQPVCTSDAERRKGTNRITVQSDGRLRLGF